MKRKIIMAVFMLMLSPAFAHAEVGLQTMFGQLFENDGATPLSEGKVLALFADTERDGFGDINFGLTGLWSSDSDDLLLNKWASNNNLGVPGISTETFALPPLNVGGLNEGDFMQLYWFDAPLSDFSADAASRIKNVGDMVYYGKYSSPTILGSSIAWQIPVDGFTYDLGFLTASTGAPDTVPDSVGRAGLSTTVLPEPVSAVLALLGAGTMALRRRFAGAAA